MSGKPWSPDELTYLKDHYGKQSLSSLSQKLHRSTSSIQHQAKRQGLTKPVNRQNWTEAEINYLIKKYEKTGAVQIAKKLSRSTQSVRHKAVSLGLDTYQRDSIYAKTLANIFGCDISVIHRWITKYQLPAKPEKHGKLIFYAIQTTDLWKCAETHFKLIPFQNYESNSLPPEPKWVANAKQQTFGTRHRNPVTEQDKSFVFRERSKGTSFPEIARQLHRTTDSVKHIWRTVKDRPPAMTQKKGQ